jgi:hypothetical protein
MKSLVKIHLILGEYKAAERYLKLLNKGITYKKFVGQYQPMLKDTTLIYLDSELGLKRSFLPPEGELHPSVEERFKQLLNANPANKAAYEHLMLYYLAGGELEKFIEFLKVVENYFNEPVPVYEEALLMHGDKTKTDVIDNYKISKAVLNRYNDFRQKQAKFNGNKKLARNALYKEFGKTYMYYFEFVLPRIVLPDFVLPTDDEMIN